MNQSHEDNSTDRKLFIDALELIVLIPDDAAMRRAVTELIRRLRELGEAE